MKELMTFSKLYLVEKIIWFVIKLPILIIFLGWFLLSYIHLFFMKKNLNEIKIDSLDEL